MQAVFALSLMVILALPTFSCEGKRVNDKTKNRSSQNQPSAPATASQKRVAEGRWGGPHLRLEVSTDGAEFEFDCAHGRLTGPLTLNNGRFAVTGTYVHERGRVRISDESEEGQRVYFKGQVEGSRMTLSFSLAEDGSEAETFTLTHGAEAKLFKCK